MAEELEPRPPASPAHPDAGRGAEDAAPHVYVRTITLRPTSALGRFALAAALIGVGALFFTVGLAVAIGVLGVAAVAGLGLAARRAMTRVAAPPPPPPPLDPSNEVKLPKPGA